MSENTVRKYIRQLEERNLITTEPTEVITKRSGRRNGNLLFTLRPIQEVIDQYYARQLKELELATERQRVANLLRDSVWPTSCGSKKAPRDRQWAAVWPDCGRAESLPLPSDRGRIWAAVPALWRESFPPPGLFAEDEKKSRKNKLPHLPAVRRGTCGRHQQQVEEGDFTHPRVGQAERLACRERLPNAFFGQKPAPTFSAPRGQLITF